jgi:hypothetical protein
MNIRKIWALALLLGATLQCSNQPKAPYPWQWAADMPFGRHDHDAVYAPDGKIYVMGGEVYKVFPRFSVGTEYKNWFIRCERDGTYSNIRFDPKANKWELMRSFPGPGTYPDYRGHDPVSDIWYYFKYTGGYGEKKEYVYFQDRIAEEKSIKKKILEPDIFKLKLRIYDCNFDRQGFDVALAVVPQGIIYWTGGESFSGPMESCAMPYDIATDSWPKRVRKNRATNITTLQVSLMSKNLYLTDQREVYSISLPPMKERRTAHRAVGLANGQIVVMGGWHNGLQPPYEPTPDEQKWIVPEECFDPQTGNWQMMIPKPVSIGTTEEQFILDSVECYDPQTNAWKYMKPMPAARIYFTAVLARDGKIYVFGGRDKVEPPKGTLCYATTWVFDPGSNTWEVRRPMPEPREGIRGALGSDGRIWLSGGDAFEGGAASPKVFIYDPQKDTWEEGPEMMLPRSGHAVIATPDGKLYAIGGSDVDAYERDPKLKEHVRPFMTRKEFDTYVGKAQEMVEVLDINAWNATQTQKKK